MSLKCFFGKHAWIPSADGEKCSNCGKTVKASFVDLGIANTRKVLESRPALIIVIANEHLPQKHKLGIRSAIHVWWKTIPTEKIVILEGINSKDITQCIAACYLAVEKIKGGDEPNKDAYLTEGVFTIPKTSCNGRVFFWKEGY